MDFLEQREVILKVTGKPIKRGSGLLGAARVKAKLVLILPSRDKKPQILQAKFAEIAQLVEHDLAKVGVASSSLVFRSKFFERIKAAKFCNGSQGGLFGAVRAVPNLFEQCRVATKSRKILQRVPGGLFGAVRAVPNLFEQCRVATKSRKFLGQKFAEIAQLVEHDLAKVGVASSSLVFRSK